MKNYCQLIGIDARLEARGIRAIGFPSDAHRSATALAFRIRLDG